MSSFRDTLAWLSIVSISTVSQLGGSSAALGQDHGSCTDVNDVALSCAAILWVSVEKDKPFIAERIIESGDESFHEKREVESRSALINIRRADPDAYLFEVPPGYKISPAPPKMSLPGASSETAVQR